MQDRSLSGSVKNHPLWHCLVWQCPSSFLRLLQDVFYIVKNQANKREKLSILSGVSGYFGPGEMTAVMGPTGSGENPAHSCLNLVLGSLIS